MAVPAERLRALNAAPVRPGRAFVLYWITAARRTTWNPALERAALRARELGKPLVVLEALRVDAPYASDRLHAFALEGMAENARRLRGRALHHAYVERARGEGDGLVAALGARACAVVADDFPTGEVPAGLAAAARALDVSLEAVDASCLVPFRLAGKDFPSAHAYRRHLQRTLPRFLDLLPAEDPLARARLPRLASLPRAVAARWPAAAPEELARPARLAASLPIDHRVAPVAALRGGARAGAARLRAFLGGGLPRYAAERSAPDARASSGLSPWLSWGHLSTFEVARAVLAREGWTPAPRRRLPRGRPRRRAHPRSALERRAAAAPRRGDDPEHPPHALGEEGARVVAVARGGPRDAARAERSVRARRQDPNGVSGVAWCLGRYDRPWGPERPVFGTVRFMSSVRTARKVALARYLARFGDGGACADGGGPPS